MRIAVLYICTGKYNQFFTDFYNSCEKFFLPEKAKKDYFVWTDDESIGLGKTNVYIHPKKCEGFPADSLFRFEMFLQAEEQLKEYDFIYFFNSNALFLSLVGEEILPDDTGLAMGIWPDIQHRHPMFYPYERNKDSFAYIPPKQKSYKYYMGGLNGGRSRDYLAMIKILAYNIRDDYNRGIIAKVHDESHINAYLRNHPCKVLGEAFCWPEEWGVSERNKIILRDKVKVDPYFNKGRRHSLGARIKKLCNYLRNAIIWYL